MIECSATTQRLLDQLVSPANRDRIAQRIRNEISENIPDHHHGTPASMERIRFSLIRLIHEGQMKEDDIFRLARIDWRDLLMAADHGKSDAHEKWARAILNCRASNAD